MCLRLQRRFNAAVRFVDPDFGPNEGDELGAFSMYMNGKVPKPGYPDPKDCEWVDGEALCGSGIKPQFVDDGPVSSDCFKGNLGDSWFISALSVLATREELLSGDRRGLEYDEDIIVDARILSNGVHPPIFHQFRSMGLYVLRFYKNF